MVPGTDFPARGLIFRPRDPPGPILGPRGPPKNMESGMNGVARPPFGLKLCMRVATGSRMPVDPLTGHFHEKSAGKWPDPGFGAPGPWGPMGPLFTPGWRCAAV